MTLIKNVKGFTSKHGLKRVPILVHFTSDDIGETLSLAADGLQITVKYKDIEAIVARERAKGYTNYHYIIDETEGDNNGSDKA